MKVIYINASRREVPHDTYLLVREERRFGTGDWVLRTGKTFKNLAGVKANSIIFSLKTQSSAPNPQSPVPFTQDPTHLVKVPGVCAALRRKYYEIENLCRI